EIDIFGSSSPPTSCTTNLPISGATASGSESTNPPSNAIDNNFATRWSNGALGSWIRVDLGSTQNICSVDIAWYNGNARQYHFVIATSTDGTTFTNKFSGDSSGTTVNSEKYIIPATDARYVRVTVNGNTQNSYASMYEIDIFGSSSSATSSSLYNYGPSLTLSGP
ncbi:MAG: discoidin domain-containing protein, partial [Thaumarchaeota archaeon]